MDFRRWRSQEIIGRDGSCRDKDVKVCYGVTRKEKIRNEYIKGTVQLERLGMKMREGRLRWYGHVIRRDQEYVGRKIMEIELPGKRKRGRPKRRFSDVVKEDIGKLVRRKWTLKIGRFGER